MSWFEPLAWISINIANSATKLMNAIILMIEKWPRSLIEMIPMSAFQMFLFYSLIFLYVQWWVRSKLSVLKVLLFVFGILISLPFGRWIIADGNAKTMIHLIEGKVVVSQEQEGEFWAFAETDTIELVS